MLLHPTAVLFNGGVMKSTSLRERVRRDAQRVARRPTARRRCACSRAPISISPWRAARPRTASRGTAAGSASAAAPRALTTSASRAPSPAVPGVEPPITALCLAPFGMEEGTEAELPPHELGVVVGEPVTLPLLRLVGAPRQTRRAPSSKRWKDGELEELAPIEVTLPAEGRARGRVVPVRLHASVTEVGTLLLEAVPIEPRKTRRAVAHRADVRSLGRRR